MKKIKYLGFIPARSGSKGVKNKNIHLLAGKPLIEYTFEKVGISELLDETHLSTDSKDIINLSKKFGVKTFYKRPHIISGDKASAIDVILYHLKWLKTKENITVENIVYLQPTSPIRSDELIDNTIKKFSKSQSNSLVTICECSQHPFEMLQIVDNKIVEFPTIKNYSRRQDYPSYFFITGSIYIINVNNLIKTNKIIDSGTDYYKTSIEEGVDIDTHLDFKIAETILTN